MFRSSYSKNTFVMPLGNTALRQWGIGQWHNIILNLYLWHNELFSIYWGESQQQQNYVKNKELVFKTLVTLAYMIGALCSPWLLNETVPYFCTFVRDLQIVIL
jgi:uncharacterized protein (UPF0303 family)